MAFEGVKWLENDLDSDIKSNVYDFLLKEASATGSELDLDSINTGLSDYDEIESRWNDSDIVYLSLRISGVKETGLGSRENLFITTDLSSSYLLQVPDEAKSDDYYIIRTDKTSDSGSMGVPGASLVGSINCRKLLEEK